MYAALVSLVARSALLEDRRWEMGVRVRVGVHVGLLSLLGGLDQAREYFACAYDILTQGG
jgi:hypothetical protein